MTEKEIGILKWCKIISKGDHIRGAFMVPFELGLKPYVILTQEKYRELEKKAVIEDRLDNLSKKVLSLVKEVSEAITSINHELGELTYTASVKLVDNTKE